MELLAANDQENLVYGLQTAAMGKQLNNGVKGFGSKTPGNKAPKTPFKIPLNDENAPFKAGKSVLGTTKKGNQDLLTGGKKGGDLDKNAFVTPAGPRTRAPLGMKTTNAKLKAFQTPAPLSGSAKTQKKTSPRLRRPKVKVHQAEPVKDDALEEEREIEYMPPRGISLPDEPEDWPSDMKYPMLEGANFTRGIYSTYFNPVGDDGLTRSEREDLEQKAKEDKKNEEIMQKAIDDMFKEVEESVAGGLLSKKQNAIIEEPKKSQKVPPTRKPLASKTPSTINSKFAAAALSPPPNVSFAASTVAAKSRLPSRLISSKKPTPMNPSVVRHAAATTASRTTIGYSQGRAASSSMRKPLSNLARSTPASTMSGTPAAPLSRGMSRASSEATITLARFAKENFTYEAEEELMQKMQHASFDEVDEEDLEDCMRGYMPAALLDDDEYDDFRLEIPAL